MYRNLMGVPPKRDKGKVATPQVYLSYFSLQLLHCNLYYLKLKIVKLTIRYHGNHTFTSLVSDADKSHKKIVKDAMH